MPKAIAALLLAGVAYAGPTGDPKPGTNIARTGALEELARADGLWRQAEAKEATCQYQEAERLLKRADRILQDYQPANGREGDRLAVVRARFQTQLRDWKEGRERLDAGSARVTALVRAGNRIGAGELITQAHAPACDARFVLAPASGRVTARR